ncbi:MAGUK p55 subfamily member 5 isoform X2 [Cimex lectularius]|uniref:MAGUK p55 subfamily member 5 n=1 Tax=Cimex lectularius TaxID=79782 RepID=A0A8I6SLJ6_CIMLE|nr:MAGUK p55 subfamily member 5 isoform X2 [Cimex lectularius]
MVDLGGYVIIICETKDKKIKLYGSPADKGDLEVGDEILEVNGKSLEDHTHTEVISHIHQCIRSRTICLRVKRRSANRLAFDLAQNSHVQDAFVIAVEAQARERLERLSALKRIKPVDMTKLSQQLNQQNPSTEPELNGFIENSPIYVTSYPPTTGASVTPSPGSTKGKKGLSNGHAVTEDLPEEIELKQELSTAEEDNEAKKEQSNNTNNNQPPQTQPIPQPQPISPQVQVQEELVAVRRASSPFSNGRTEVLIGQDVPSTGEKLRTTALIENKNLTTPPDCITRPRRRSGSSLVEADKVSGEPAEDAYSMMVVMSSLENGPHREMPVDVPESFIARSKTPPRYPPPRPANRGALNGSAGSPGKPVPPPREPLPRPPPAAQRNINNNTTAELSKEPTKQQLDSIKKYQEQLRKRKEEEERVAQQELINRSLRGSKKLQALESRPGLVNDAFATEEPPQEDTLHKIVGYGEIVASLQRLQSALKRSGFTSLERSLSAVQSLLSGPQFSRALSTHNRVQEALAENSFPRPVTTQSQTLVRDFVEGLQSSSSVEAVELCEVLGRYEFEGLLYAHDAVAREVWSPTTTPTKSMPPTAPFDPPRSKAPTPVQEDDSNIKIIKIEKTNEPLGATVRNEGESVMIGRVVRGGAADKSGLLHEGDEVLEVNGVEMRGKSVNEVCDLLSAMTGTLTFLIVPAAPVYTHTQHRTDTLMHMKANFDYDPEDDLYIPCRELGISFQKGDVLHVICQDDPNWWQAYREGEEDQTLAGLIPSKSFQQQREAMKQSTITGDKLNREKSKKAGTFLCAKKNTKKKKKKSYSDAGYPIYATNLVDDFDQDEIMTYDEVALYYPRANHKRPIVLIGPPNIGRHELRQRLMEDSDRFAAAIPHTSRSKKDGEVDGQDYHFITRAQFEADILARKFVEHGEYERAYYGTSLDAIRSVVSAGRICVLNLHPQSLKILRSSDLKPYVVFVAPPSLEKLRQKKIRSGESYKEEELKDIIEKAREMEDKYGHYFDMIINNNDTERAYLQLLNEINILEREPQWVPASWVKAV